MNVINKKYKTVVGTLLILCFLYNNALVFAQDNSPKLEVNATSALLMDANSGTILFEKKPHERHEPASITKIMTLLIAFEALDSGKANLKDEIKISENAWKTGGSQVFLASGETQTLETLLKCITIASANDASVAVAEHIGGSCTGFVKMMNDKAKELGMKNSNFTNPHGLSDLNNYTTAYDIALMSRELIKHQKFFEWSTIWMDYLEHTDKKRDPTMLANTNRLIGKYEGLDGIKTGFHKNAGHCFAGTAKRGNLRLISVVLNSESSKQRFEDTTNLLDYGFGHYEALHVVEKNSIQKVVPLEKGLQDTVNIVANEDFFIIIEKGKDIDIETEIKIPEKLSAPLKKGQKVGSLEIRQKGKLLNQIDLVIGDDIKKAGIIDMVRNLMFRWLKFQISTTTFLMEGLLFRKIVG